MTPRPRRRSPTPPGDLGHREQDVLGGEVVVAEVGALGVGRLEHAGRRRATSCGAAGPSRRRPWGSLASAASTAVADRLRRDAHPLEDRQHHALGLADQRREQVLGRDLGVVALARERLGGTQGLAGLAGELVGIERHGGILAGRAGGVRDLITRLSSLSFPAGVGKPPGRAGSRLHSGFRRTVTRNRLPSPDGR